MSPFHFEFDEGQGTYETIPAGIYMVTLNDLDENQGEKGPYFKMKLIVADGEHEGHVLWRNLSMSPAAAGFVKQFLVATGEDPEALVGEYDFDPYDYMDAEFRVQVKVKPYEGEPKNEVTKFLPPAEKASKARGRAVR